jgi:hypothetical protein
LLCVMESQLRVCSSWWDAIPEGSMASAAVEGAGGLAASAVFVRRPNATPAEAVEACGAPRSEATGG